jgi:hypothetical protein
VSRRSLRSIRAHGSHDSELPLKGYFLWVGGALLTLLFAADWLVSPPTPNALINSHVTLPPIRIHSESKAPDAVDLRPAIVAALTDDTAVPTHRSSSADAPAAETFQQQSPSILSHGDENDGSPASAVEPAPNTPAAFARFMTRWPTPIAASRMKHHQFRNAKSTP